MVALKMRDLSGLQARVANGERISSDELAAKYYPLAADYQTQLDWLIANRFKIVKTDTRRFAIFASGTIAQVQAAFQVQFGGVNSNGKLFHSAITAPSLPAQIAAPVLGINGLQPHLQRHSHARKAAFQGRSAKDHNPPFLPSEILHAYNADGVTATGMGQENRDRD